MADSAVAAKPQVAGAKQAKHPSGDNRFKILEATMKRYQYHSDALIEVLNNAQQLFGFLDDDLLLLIAHKLKAPPSRVYGVATFYHLFTLKPQGRHSCVICLGTACYVKGANALANKVMEVTGVKLGETTEDNSVSLLSARCIGACGIAPTVVLDGAITGHETVEEIGIKLQEWMNNGSE
jgi:bidirectional [NiFe] hydrogenase diaphorase subunit